jgi:hypothetical protein
MVYVMLLASVGCGLEIVARPDGIEVRDAMARFAARAGSRDHQMSCHVGRLATSHYNVITYLHACIPKGVGEAGSIHQHVKGGLNLNKFFYGTFPLLVVF